MRRRLATVLALGIALLVALTSSATSTPTTTTSTATTTTATTTTGTSTTAPTTATKPTAPAQPAQPVKPTSPKDPTPAATKGSTTSSTTRTDPATGTATGAASTTATGAAATIVPKTQAELDADAAAAADGTADASATDETTGAGAGAPVVDPTLPQAPPPPPVHALSWLVVDGTDGTEVAGHAVESRRAIASITKLMTALLVVERTKGNELVPIDRHAVASDGGSSLSMQPGQTYKVDDLLDAMLVHSANDAAVALAEYVGGGGAEGEASFRKMMNDRAARLGMGATHFTSVNGLDGLADNSPPATRSTARDLVKLLTAVYGERRLRDAVALPSVDFQRPGQTTLTFPNRNTLLASYPGVDGVKTGHTDAAGYCLLTHYAGSDGEWWVLVLGDRVEKFRDGDTVALLDWARTLRQKVTVAHAGDEVGSAPVDDGSGRAERLYVSSDMRPRMRIGARVQERLRVAGRLQPPLRAGDEVGTFDVLADGKVVARSRVYVDRAVHRQTRRQRLHRLAHELPRAWRLGAGSVHRQERRFMDYWGF